MADTRRLAAIMFTDTVGSTASAQTDETAALKMRREQEGVVRPLFSVHQGREVKSMGDGFLVEFESALDAVRCAVEIQQALHEHNLLLPDPSRIRIRIGIHLGDVIHTGDDVFGDSVNIAARIEPLAEPEGICVSEPVFGQVRNKIPQPLERLPPRRPQRRAIPVGPLPGRSALDGRRALFRESVHHPPRGPPLRQHEP